MPEQNAPESVSITDMAARLGVPEAWLRRKINEYTAAGRAIKAPGPLEPEDGKGGRFISADIIRELKTMGDAEGVRVQARTA